jgi:flagellar biosynthetic protein FlhB
LDGALMQEEQSAADKPHEATPRKLDEARRKGDIVRSVELNTAVVYIGFLVSGLLFAPRIFETLGRLMQVSLERADPLSALLLAADGESAALAVLSPPLLATAVVLGAPAALLILALVAQRGIVFAPDKLSPKLSRVSPIANAKNKFGPEGLFQFAKSAVKLVVVSALLAVYLRARAEPVLATIHASPGQIIGLIGRLTVEFMSVVAGLSVLLGGLDWLWEWSRHMQRNRMSRQEFLDESKSAEGDPHMKQERRQRGQLIATNRMMAEVPRADVVVVNPTHFAVALKWDRAGGEVPVCVAKGVDEIAGRIRALAAEAGVPVYSDPPTARALHATVEVGAPIQPGQYRAVAAAIRFADAMRKRAARRP